MPPVSKSLTTDSARILAHRHDAIPLAKKSSTVLGGKVIR
jgi:hypothetical protein